MFGALIALIVSTIEKDFFFLLFVVSNTGVGAYTTNADVG